MERVLRFHVGVDPYCTFVPRKAPEKTCLGMLSRVLWFALVVSIRATTAWTAPLVAALYVEWSISLDGEIDPDAILAKPIWLATVIPAMTLLAAADLMFILWYTHPHIHTTTLMLSHSQADSGLCVWERWRDGQPRHRSLPAACLLGQTMVTHPWAV